MGEQVLPLRVVLVIPPSLLMRTNLFCLLLYLLKAQFAHVLSDLGIIHLLELADLLLTRLSLCVQAQLRHHAYDPFDLWLVRGTLRVRYV